MTSRILEEFGLKSSAFISSLSYQREEPPNCNNSQLSSCPATSAEPKNKTSDNYLPSLIPRSSESLIQNCWFSFFLIVNIEVINTGPYNDSLKVIVIAPKEQILFKNKQVWKSFVTWNISDSEIFLCLNPSHLFYCFYHLKKFYFLCIKSPYHLNLVPIISFTDFWKFINCILSHVFVR